MKQYLTECFIPNNINDSINRVSFQELFITICHLEAVL